MKVCLAQVAPVVGDLRGNLEILKNKTLDAWHEECDVVVFPELVTVGYPPRDLLYNQAIWDNHKILVETFTSFVRSLKNITVIFGGLHQDGRNKYNAAYIIDDEQIRIVHKRLLPEYNIFNEARYFHSGLGEDYQIISIKTQQGYVDCSVVICEDMWNFQSSCDVKWLPSAYLEDPVSNLKGDGPIFIINGSPYWRGKIETTQKILATICNATHRVVYWVNQVGAHDDIVTGGYSMVFHPESWNVDKPLIMGKLFEEDRIVIDPSWSMILPKVEHFWYDKVVEAQDWDLYCDYLAIKLHLADYLRKTGFSKAVLGVSGGIDSALVCAIAVDVLGPTNVTAVSLPSQYSSGGSLGDANGLAKNLNITDYRVIPIKEMHEIARKLLLPSYSFETRDSLRSSVYISKKMFSNPLVDENIQPRIRALLLMAISNEDGSILLTTSNKSEGSVGYTTLYGDMSGGIAPIIDLFKTDVFKMCRLINKYAGREIIPQTTIEKPPSAELREGQLDNQSLPEYDLLDPILEMFINDVPIEQIKQKTTIPDRVDEIVKKIYNSEFKRAQAPLGPKLKLRSFDSGRLIPIAKRVSFVDAHEKAGI